MFGGNWARWQVVSQYCFTEMLDQMGEAMSEPGNGAKGASGAGTGAGGIEPEQKPACES